MAYIKSIVAAAALAAGVGASANAAQSNAIVTLFSGTDTQSEQTVSDLGCSIYRSGLIVDQKGPLKVDGALAILKRSMLQRRNGKAIGPTRHF